MSEERENEIIRACFEWPSDVSMTDAIRESILKAYEMGLEEAAITAWNTGMLKHDQLIGMPGDARDIGSSCANAIRELKSKP